MDFHLKSKIKSWEGVSRAQGVIFMIIGSAMIMALLIMMNRTVIPKKQKTKTIINSFKVEPKKKPKKQKRKKLKKKKLKKMRAPKPEIFTGLRSSGISLSGGFNFASPDASEYLNKGLKDASDLVMNEESVDVLPKAVRRSAPKYPGSARARGITGKVVLRILIDKQGRVSKVKVIDSSPKGVFEQSAIEAIKNWQYNPAIYQGQRVKIWANQTINFNLG